MNSDDKTEADLSVIVVKYIDDTISEMHWWASFQEDDGDDALVFNVIREKVGRNDPCPRCSGKKYKKCCLP